MKNLLIGLAFIAGTLTANSAMAMPSATPAWNGSSAYILSNTPSSPKYRCAYSVGVTFADGTSTVSSGTTDPTTGAQNHRAVIINFSKAVTGVQIRNWNCKAIG